MNIKSLKATRAGRAMTRLFGEEKGAVLMEYVVLGVLILAAVVGIVIAIGNRISDNGKIIIKAGGGETEEAAAVAEEAREKAGKNIDDATGRRNRINKGEYQ